MSRELCSRCGVRKADCSRAGCPWNDDLGERVRREVEALPSVRASRAIAARMGARPLTDLGTQR